MKEMLAVLSLTVSSVVHADTAIIDPSAYAPGTDVSAAYAGATLSTAQGIMQVYDTTVYESLHLTSDAANPVYSTGSRFAHAVGDLWNANDYAGCCGGDQVLKVEFRKAATSVAVQFYPDDTDTAVLQIYDRKSELLAETYVRQSGPHTVSLDAPRGKRIAYALATYADPGRIGPISFTVPGKIR